MSDDVLELLVAIHHQLTTDSDLEHVSAPEKYHRLVYEIEKRLLGTCYDHLCWRFRQVETLVKDLTS